ncbi:MAG: exodeoxyribonuclease III [Candidatus Latescibacterota bacterium]|jgi:exodeoxyribonuclease-3
MKIATWNVNSLKVRLPQVLAWLARERPEVLAVQEIKLTEENYPFAEIAAAGYTSICSGQKSYNGVAVLSRQEALDPVTDLPGLDDPQRRVLALTVGDLRLLNLYVPNGGEVGSEKYAYKLEWLAQCRAWVEAQLERYPRLVVVGDLNVAPEDRDVHDPALWAGQILCSEPERERFRGLLATGLSDAFRLFEQPEGSWSWWDYRMAAFRRNLGLRIDHVLVSEPLRQSCTSCRIDREPRGWERPSDHAPVVAEFSS